MKFPVGFVAQICMRESGTVKSRNKMNHMKNMMKKFGELSRSWSNQCFWQYNSQWFFVTCSLNHVSCGIHSFSYGPGQCRKYELCRLQELFHLAKIKMISYTYLYWNFPQKSCALRLDVKYFPTFRK